MEKQDVACTSINEPSDTIHNEMSYWTDEEIWSMYYDVHLSVTETWQAYAAI
jgi:hypothetical protein